jgi:succinoglycan biosynthesis transport protein ExoP
VSTESPGTSARYVTLRDYLGVLSRYKIMIGLLTVVGAVAGFVYATQQTPSYSATAQVNFQDPSQALGVVGLATNSPETPVQIASVAAVLVNSPSVMNQVSRELGPSASAQEASAGVAAQVSVTSGLLEITTTSPNAAFAAKLANTVAAVLVSQENSQAQTQFAQLARHVQRQIAHMRATQNPAEQAFYEDELGRLNTLAAFAKTAQLTESAQTAGASSGGRTRNTLLGLLFGLLLGIAVAFIRDATDRRLRSPQDMKDSFRLPVLTHVRNQTMGQVARLNGDSNVDFEAFRILRRNLEVLDPDQPPHSILVTSAAPQEGKTTVASSLAVSLASAGRRTLLVECDLRRPALAARFGVEQSPGITDYLAGKASPQAILRTVPIAAPKHRNGGPPTTNGNGHGAAELDQGGSRWANGCRTPGSAEGQHEQRLIFIPSGSNTPLGSELLASSRFREFVEQVSEAYDAVVFDSSPLLLVSDTLEILPSVDAVVVCARASRTTQAQASAAKEALSRFPERPIGLVVTGIKPGGDEYGVYASAGAYS